MEETVITSYQLTNGQWYYIIEDDLVFISIPITERDYLNRTYD